MTCGPSRATARVRVAAAPLGESSPDRLRRALKEALDRAGVPSMVVRRYRGDPSPLVRDMTAGWRSGRFRCGARRRFRPHRCRARLKVAFSATWFWFITSAP